MEEILLDIVDLHFTYRDNPPVYALKGVSLNIKRGEIYALLGPNGAGKTTLVHSILGFLKPDRGEILIKGEKVIPDKKDLLSKIGFEPQENILWDFLTVKEHLELMGILYGISKETLRERINYLLSKLQMEEKSKTKVKQLSGGLKRRLQLMISLINDPHLLLLDEPSGGLDPQSRHFLWEFIKEKKEEGKGILLTTHLMEEAQRVADRIGILDNGKIIAEGTTDELIKRYGGPTLEDVFINLTGRRLRE
jgi:ABC-type multidrug transport system ATPase subunit